MSSFFNSLLQPQNIINGTRDDDTFKINEPFVPDSLVRLGRGNDDFTVNTGNHEIYGGRGNDNINSGDGNDYINGGRGNDNINGGAGNDDIKGGRGDDDIYGGIGNDEIEGGRGNDNILGGGGNDHINGGRGNDDINGGAGDDSVSGGRGNDTLRGGSGHDELHGGRGDDVFVHVAGDNVTEVFDFEKGKDLIQLDFDGVDNLGQVLNIAQQVTIEENRIEVVVDANNTLIVHGLGQNDVPDLSDYFIF